MLKSKKRGKEESEEEEEETEMKELPSRAPKFMEIKAGSEIKQMDSKSVIKKRKLQKWEILQLILMDVNLVLYYRKSLGERLQADKSSGILSKSNGLGNMEMTFALQKVRLYMSQRLVCS
jgi:hypothetical protein